MTVNAANALPTTAVNSAMPTQYAMHTGELVAVGDDPCDSVGHDFADAGAR